LAIYPALFRNRSFQGRGEYEPAPYLYQNLAEAEYLVSVYQYMCLLGYPSSKIVILTTYSGQKMLLKDVLEKRCSNSNFIGKPSMVTTVDKYQGQQNDYVLLSLVRTRSVGHLRELERLVVSMSRARLGLYIFGRHSVFANCYELSPTFKQLINRPSSLSLIPYETWGGCQRLVGDPVPINLEITGLVGMTQLIVYMSQQFDHSTLVQHQTLIRKTFGQKI